MSGSARAGGCDSPRPLTSSSWCIGEQAARRGRCAKRSPRCWHRWGCGFQRLKPRWCTSSDGFDFLGFRIRRKRKRGTNKHVHLYLHRPTPDPVVEGARSVPSHIRTSQQDTRVRAGQAQSGHARLGELLQTCRRQERLQHAGQLHLVANRSAWLRVRHHWRWNEDPPTIHRPNRPMASNRGR